MNSYGEILIYNSKDGKVSLDVKLENETLWLSQKEMSELFNTTQQNISQHILGIVNEEELTLEATNKKSLLVRKEGNREV